MNEVKTLSVAERSQVLRGFGCRDIFAESQQGLQAEDGVIDVGTAGAISEAAAGLQLAGNELLYKAAGISEQLGRESRDLQHFESQTHCTNLVLRE